MPRLLRYMAFLLTLFLGGWMHYAQAEVYSGDCNDYISWTLDTETGRLTIHGDPVTAAYTGDYRSSNAPWYEYREYIRSAYLGAGGWVRMNYHLLKDLPNLTSLILSDSCRGSNQPVIVNCPNLSSIVVKDGNPVYDSRDNCNAVVNHESSTNIYILIGCKGTIIPPSVQKINQYAFMGAGMRAMTIPSSITIFSSGYGGEAFADCPNLEEFHVSWTTASAIPSWPSNFTNKTPQSAIKLYVPCGKTDIYAAKNGWKDYTIIEERAGGTCGAIGNENELSWSLSCDASTLTISGSGAMKDWSAETDVPWYNWRESITSVVLPYGLTHVGDYAFRGTHITKLDLPSALQTIGKYAFSATPLIEVCIPEGVTSIGEKAFISGSEYVCINEACNALLRRVYLPSTLTELGNASIALAHLQYLTYPKSITTLGHTYYYQSKYPAKELYASWTTNIPSRYGPIATVTEPKQKMHIPYGTTAAYRAKDWARVHDLVEDVDERAIDLGLSVRWASCNVGATAPEEIGTHFMWGDTIARSKYTVSAYPYCGANLNTLTKYNTRSSCGPVVDNRTTLIAFDDAAYINWGETWRMPTEAEWQELLDNCTLEKTTLNGVEVLKVTGPNGNFIYLPKVGYKMDSHDGSGYCYWSSSLNTGELDDGCTKAIYLNGTSGLKKAYRYIGMGVRAVYRREWPSFTLTICDTTDGSTYTKAINAAATYTLTAKEDDCHTFVRWSDGNTDKTRTVTVTADANYTAEYEEITYSGTCGPEGHESDVTWTLNLCDSVMTISGTGAMKDWGTLETAPWYGQKDIIKTIIVSDGITTIGSRAFHRCNNLESATLPEGLTEIKEYAFYECGKLVSVTIPDGVTGIGEWAFYNCSALPSIDIPNTVTSIGINVFFNCANLSSATLSTALTVIPKSIFQNCAKLESIDIPSNVTTIENYAFYGCKKISAITIPDKVTSIKKNAFQRCSGLTSVVIPNTVTEIGNHAFSECSNLQSVEIQGTTSLGESAFERCGKLETFTISGVVTSLGKTAFSECSKLTSISFPEGLTDIGASAFFQCSKLASVTIPNGVTSIGESAFFWCEPLTSFDIPSSVTGIGDYSLLWCTDLTEVNVHWTEEDQILTCPDNIHDKDKDEVILHIPCGTTAFYTDKSWNTKFTLDDGSVSGTCGTTGNEDGVTWTLCDSVLTISGTGAMKDCSLSTDAPWYSYRQSVKTIVIGDDITTIGNYAFYECENATSVTIGSHVTSIGKSAFRYCKALTSIILPNGVTTIGNNAFSFCTDLSSITIPNGVTTIGEYAFRACQNLLYLTIPNSVTSIGYYALSSFTSDLYVSWLGADILTYSDQIYPSTTTPTLHIPCGTTQDYTDKGWRTRCAIAEDVSNILSGTCGAEGDNLTWSLSCDSVLTISGSGAMKDWTTQANMPWNSYKGTIKTVVIEDGVTNIGGNSFIWCTKLSSVTIPESVTSIGHHAFCGCTSLKSVELPSHLESIGRNAFESNSFTSIRLPETLSTMGIYIFGGSSKVTDIYVEWTENIPDYPTFKGNITGITLHVPCGTQAIYQAADGWKDFTIEGEGTYTFTVSTDDDSMGSVEIMVVTP